MPKKEMLINYVPGEECRIAIVEDGRLEELYHERASSESHVNNIYKGRITNVEPAIQAAFVDFGLERNGFLHISDLHPKYFPGDMKDETERVGQKTPRRERPPIQHCLKRGQEVVVQVLKEGIGTKGPTLTTYLSIPGRFLVMMPDMERLGVSRKVEDDEQRRAARKILEELDPPKDYGFIIRTAGMDRTKTDLKRDLAYLMRLAKAIERRRKDRSSVGDLYTESDLIIRTLRDIFASDIERVIVDHPDAARRAGDFLAIASPRAGSKVFYYNDAIPLFHRYGVEAQIEGINARVVPLKSGGSLVIDSTEALVAIDVNSGKMRENRDAETTAYKTNVEACDEICRQLRVRDLGGVVVCDLIDMRDTRHRRDIEHRFRENLKKDRARTKTLPISQFGILEMTRQRMRPSLKTSTHSNCSACDGRGYVRSAETVVLDAMRRLALVLSHERVAKAELTVSPDVAFLLLNRKRTQLVALESTHNTPVMVRVAEYGPLDSVELTVFDNRGTAIDLETLRAVGEPRLEPVSSLGPIDDDEPDADLDLTDDRDDSAESVDKSRDSAEADDDTPTGSDDTQTGDGKKKKRRRRRGGRRRKAGDASDVADTNQAADSSRSDDDEDSQPSDDVQHDDADGNTIQADKADKADTADGSEAPKKKRRRRRRRRKSTDTAETAENSDSQPDDRAPNDYRVKSSDAQADEDDDNDNAQPDDAQPTAAGDNPDAPKKKRRRRRGGRRRSGRKNADGSDNTSGDGQSGDSGSDEPVAAGNTSEQSSS